MLTQRTHMYMSAYLFLSLDFPRERVPVVLAPLLYQNQLDITEERQVMVPQTAPEVSTTS